LLQGESGTGKEVYGRLIHQLSAMRDLPLVKLSCTVLEPGDLLSRVKTSLGKWNGEPLGSSGTLFLDGIDELGLDCQRVLLAMLQEQEMVSGGRMGFRLISTTTRNVDREIALGGFAASFISGSTVFASSCRRCANERKTSQHWRNIS